MNKADAHNSDALGRLASIAAGYPFRGKIDALPNGDVAGRFRCAILIPKLVSIGLLAFTY